MTNPLRGETSFEVEGKIYRLRFSWNAAAEFEAPAGRSFYDAMDDMAAQRLSIRTLRAMLWAALQENHRGLSLEETGRLMEKIGHVEAWLLVRKTMELFFPTPEKTADPTTAPAAPTPPSPVS